MDYPSLGDNVDGGRPLLSLSVSSDHLDPLSASERSSECYDDDVYMNDTSSEISDTSRLDMVHLPDDLPRGRNKYLYPTNDTVEPLRPEEVRWMYRDPLLKRWIAFIGYDSLRIECKYREMHYGVGGRCEDNIEMIVVRGGLYEADVVTKKCYPIYWTTENNTVDIMRGMWFFETTWQPMEENYAAELEEEHLDHYSGQKIPNGPPVLPKGVKKVHVHQMKFKEFHIDWYQINDIYFYSEATSSRLYRRMGHAVGMQKSSGGTKLYRGYYTEAKPDDKPADISHLVFVIHGIGQKMETGSIIRSCGELRDGINKMKLKYFAELNHSNQRAEFLPVEWRSSLKLDGDIVDSVTPAKVKGLRTILNSSAMDILYYTSPLYRSEITHGLQTELNRLYSMFCARHPYFEPNGGKVSIVAHSLGCVITYDIIMGWNPIQLYDQYVATVMDEHNKHTEGANELLQDLERTRKRVSELEVELLALAERQHMKLPTLGFRLENFICLGSPLAVFLALRGVRPRDDGTQEHILPTRVCKRLFNVFHPADPVAYRLEPLILKHYSDVIPLKIHKCDQTRQVEMTYSELPIDTYSDKKNTVQEESVRERNNNGSDSDCRSDISGSPSRDQIKPPAASISNRFSGVWARWSKKPEPALTDEVTQVTQELEVMERDAKELEIRMNMSQENDHYNPDDGQKELDHRLDYQLREKSMENTYLAVLTAHTSYWTNPDIGLFILTQLHPEYRANASRRFACSTYDNLLRRAFSLVDEL